ncbi:glycosyltransferase family 4 protein [Neobacillus niacini]|uniref:glycosyltransferase family 4 protein n=1 Tax=Neobacillus niacini TaxID=86668 RepID=UPI00285AE4DA|nr:glycosyltransferase family 4 protein [Neobacillus niacini]MDR6999608.1 glycosyltransferase involved in cell wall biosynthesis [Neobacillus niacini]
MTKAKFVDLPPLPAHFPYLIAAMDQYYGVASNFVDKPIMKKGNAPEGKKQNKKLRILITTFWDYHVIGGLQNYIANLKDGLEKLGYLVDVFSPEQFPIEETKGIYSDMKDQFKKFFLDRYGTVSQKILINICNLSLYKMMLMNVDFSKYDIIHAQDRFTCNVLGTLNEASQKPILFTPHGFMTHSKLKFNLIEKGSIEERYFSTIDEQAIKNANQLIILCDAFRPILKKLGAKNSSMTTVYTGIDFEVKKFQNGQNKIIITCVSRLRPRKGHKYLFEALSLLKDDLYNVEVRIVGDGEMREELENQIRELKLKNVYFLGSRNDIPKLLRQSDIFVQPTISDTLPISIIEAMFARQAILATNVGGIPEIIQDNYTGLIIEPANPKQLAEKLLLLVQNQLLRIRLAKQAKNFADEQLTVTNMVKEIDKIYRSLL